MNDRILFTISEVSGLLGIGRTKLYQIIASGDLPVVHIGRSVRIYRPELEAWLDKIANHQPDRPDNHATDASWRHC